MEKRKNIGHFLFSLGRWLSGNASSENKIGCLLTIPSIGYSPLLIAAGINYHIAITRESQYNDNFSIGDVVLGLRKKNYEWFRGTIEQEPDGSLVIARITQPARKRASNTNQPLVTRVRLDSFFRTTIKNYPDDILALFPNIHGTRSPKSFFYGIPPILPISTIEGLLNINKEDLVICGKSIQGRYADKSAIISIPELGIESVSLHEILFLEYQGCPRARQVIENISLFSTEEIDKSNLPKYIICPIKMGNLTLVRKKSNINVLKIFLITMDSEYEDVINQLNRQDLLGNKEIITIPHELEILRPSCVQLKIYRQ